MKQIENKPLMKGVFEPEEAKEILTNLFRSKISFHNGASWTALEHTGKQSPHHIQRAQELRDSLKEILKVIDEASIRNSILEINCDVEIRVIQKI